jgi:hypothetical protein
MAAFNKWKKMNRTKVMNKKMADNRIYTVARQNGNKYF